MQMFLPFGDWSRDGHGMFETRLIEVPSKDHILKAQNKICEKYGKDIWSGFANEYDEPFFSKEVWNMLIENDYPVERFKQLDENDIGDDENVHTWKDVFAISFNPYISIEVVIDAAIFLLNKYGAEITLLDEIPTVYWRAPGYGCFSI